jgi:hypothetical protein
MKSVFSGSLTQSSLSMSPYRGDIYSFGESEDSSVPVIVTGSSVTELTSSTAVSTSSAFTGFPANASETILSASLLATLFFSSARESTHFLNPSA